MSDRHCTRSGHYRWVCFECAREERRKLERERDEALRQLKERGVICASDFCQYDTYLDLRNCRDAALAACKDALTLSEESTSPDREDIEAILRKALKVKE